MNKNSAAHQAAEFTSLQYLERVIDFEDSVDRGPLAEKEVLVYSFGKTGTLTIYHSIGRFLKEGRKWASYENKILHNHNNALLVRNLKRLPGAPSLEELHRRPVIKELLRYKELVGGHALVVSSYREPLSRAISSVFQQVEDKVFRARRQSLDTIALDTCRERVLETLQRYAGGEMLHPIEEIEEDFFEQESFDHDEKCCYVNRGHYEILLLSLEHADAWSSALEKHFGWGGIEIVAHNIAGQKKVGGLYHDFKAHLELPDPLLKEVYYSGHERKYLSWFCTEEEISALHERALRSYGSKRPKPAASSPGWRPESDVPGKRRRLASDRSRKTMAKLTVLECSRQGNQNQIRVSVRLENEGETTWLPGPKQPGTVALSLRSVDDKGKWLSSNWHQLPEMVDPGGEIIIATVFTVPEHTAERNWYFDLICVGEYWFSAVHGLREKVYCHPAGESSQ